MQINIETVIEHIKNSDQRFRENIPITTIKYSIQQALTELATKTLCFTVTETALLEDEFADDIENTYIEPQKDIIDYYDIYTQNIKTKEITRRKKYDIANDKKIYIKIDELKGIKNIALVLKYYYVPVLQEEEYISITPEMYNILIDLVLAYMWKYFKDYEKYTVHSNLASLKMSQKSGKDMPDDYQIPPITARGFM
jgi:hypothetical protein